jgi:alpha-beta hydrolase superfamily lysophospholipase
MKLAQRIVLGYYRNKFKTLALISPRKAAEEAFKLLCTPYSRRKNIIPAPAVFKEAENLSFTLAENTIRGFRWRPKKDNGKKVLICHGFDSSSYKFEKYITGLLDLGFGVLAFDAPAHGISTGKTVNAHQYQQVVLKIYNDYGPVDGFLAHSFGGLAVALAIEKINNHQHKRLVLIAPATETIRLINTFFSYIPVSDKIKVEFDKLIEEIGGNPASWFSVARVLQQVTTPTLWVHDKKDSVTPYEDMHHLVEKKLPHIDFEITEGLGHSLYNDDAVMKRIIAFLNEL